MKGRGFSLYDIEQYLKEAGAERVNEKAVISLEKELEDTVNELVEEAIVYANYAGRKKLIKSSDIALVDGRFNTKRKRIIGFNGHKQNGNAKRVRNNTIPNFHEIKVLTESSIL